MSFKHAEFERFTYSVTGLSKKQYQQKRQSNKSKPQRTERAIARSKSALGYGAARAPVVAQAKRERTVYLNNILSEKELLAVV